MFWIQTFHMIHKHLGNGRPSGHQTLVIRTLLIRRSHLTFTNTRVTLSDFSSFQPPKWFEWNPATPKIWDSDLANPGIIETAKPPLQFSIWANKVNPKSYQKNEIFWMMTVRRQFLSEKFFDLDAPDFRPPFTFLRFKRSARAADLDPGVGGRCGSSGFESKFVMCSYYEFHTVSGSLSSIRAHGKAFWKASWATK